MRTKNLIILVIALTVSTSAIAFGSQTQFLHRSFGFVSDVFTRDKSADIPDHVLYDKLFRMVNSFKKKVESQEIIGEKAVSAIDYFKSRANLNGEENQTLQNIALEYAQKIAPIDAQAKAIIVQARKADSTGIISKSQPPAELTNLQEQRNALALLYRDRLKESLGSDAAARFDSFVEGEFASRFESIPLSSVNFDQVQ